MQHQRAVLVVEHTPAGIALSAALREAGWDVMLCHRGLQALDSVRLQPWDALVIGFRLIDMRGDAVAYAASAERPELAGRILILTEDQMDSDTAKGSSFSWLPTSTPVDEIVARLEQFTTPSVQEK
jgi:DNA-binding response OmpR family regulator